MADEGRSLAPKKRPGSEPKLDDGARRLLESDVEERPAATLLRRRECLQKVGGAREIVEGRGCELFSTCRPTRPTRPTSTRSSERSRRSRRCYGVPKGVPARP